MNKMKDSDVLWVDRIPENWDVLPLKSCFNFGKGLSITKADLTETGEAVISYGQIHSKKCDGVHINDKLIRYVSNNTVDEKSRAIKGGFIFADTSEDLAGCGNAIYVERDGVYGGYHTIVLTPLTKGEDNRYYGYLFKTDAWRHQLRSQLTDVKLFSISQKALKNTSIIVPSSDERIAIADYLDYMNDSVAEVINRHQSIIEKLEEYKISIITQAVTKGLNPDVEMKDSGIDYIGNYPLSWILIRIKYLLSERNTRSITGGEEPLSMSQVYGLIPTSQMDRVPLIAATNVGAKIAHKSDLVFNKLKAHLGVFAVSNYDGLVSPDYAVYTSKGNSNPKYLEYLFKTETYICEFKKRSTGVGAGLTRLYTSELFEIKCAIPSLKEQQLIVDYLDKKCEGINNAVSRQKDAIEKLEEYRKSLIYNTVTGKIDCREVTYEKVY